MFLVWVISGIRLAIVLRSVLLIQVFEVNEKSIWNDDFRNCSHAIDIARCHTFFLTLIFQKGISRSGPVGLKFYWRPKARLSNLSNT